MILAPEHPYWDQHKAPTATVNDRSRRRAIFISPVCSEFWDELVKARYRDRADVSVNQPETEVDAFNHVRKALSYVQAEGAHYYGFGEYPPGLETSK